MKLGKNFDIIMQDKISIFRFGIGWLDICTKYSLDNYAVFMNSPIDNIVHSSRNKMLNNRLL